MDERDAAILSSIPWYRQVLYALLLFGVALLLAEGGMRLHYFLKDDFPPIADESLEYEWKWVSQHLEAGTAASDGSSNREFDPKLGWRMRPNYHGDEVRTNSRGMRADREYPPGRQPGRRRIALVGDSFTFGDHVTNEETYGYVLENELLSGWDVMNFAVGGYGTDQALLAYEMNGGDLAADIVVMGFFVRDYERNLMRFKIFAKPHFELDANGEGLRLVDSPVITPEALYAEYENGTRKIGAVDAPYLWLSIERSLQRHRKHTPSESDPEWQLLARIMRRFRDHVRAQGAVPVWLVIPYRDVVEGGRSKYAAIEEMCEREASALGMSLLRVDESFHEFSVRNPDVLLYRPRDVGGHFSAAGHHLIAQELAAHLEAEGLLERRASN